MTPKLKDRAGRRLTREPYKDLAARRFKDNVDMDSLKLFLEDAGTDKYDTFLAMLADPAYIRLSFAALARKANVTLQELQELYSNGMRHLGLLKLATALPDIIGDVAIDARTTMESCHRCDGLMVVPFGENGTKPCPMCKGKGEIRRVGDKQARELVFESAKLTGQTGPLVAIQNNFAGTDSRMESMLKRTRSIVLEPIKKTIDEKDPAE